MFQVVGEIRIRWALAFLSLFPALAHADWKVQRVQVPGGSPEVVSVQEVPARVLQPTQLIGLPEALYEGSRRGLRGTSGRFEEFVYPERLLPADCEAFLARPQLARPSPAWAGSEVRTILQQGPDENRIKLVIVGDGYTELEKDRYFEDVKRLIDGMFAKGTPFESYLPLFNVYAVFVPSRESGITDLVRKNTALSLYRAPKGSKRGILPGDRWSIERALRLAPVRADFPILVANDEFYGGLGGRYAITTRSLTSGLIVLFHELGHNFGNVGEEYPGGQVYSGANHARSLRSVSRMWRAWVGGEIRGHEADMLNGSYIWQDLNGRPVEIDFDISRTGEQYLSLIISTVGWETIDDVHVILDGERIEMQGNYHADRSFFRYRSTRPVSPGPHRLEIVQQVRGGGQRVLAFANVFAIPEGYEPDPDKVDAFATFYGPDRRAGFRPTHNGCLMRDMTLGHFCPICKENFWHQFFERVGLIDGVAVGADVVRVETPALPGLSFSWVRTDGPDAGEPLPIEGPEAPRDSLEPGRYRVTVRFHTPEVRSPTERFHEIALFEIP